MQHHVPVGSLRSDDMENLKSELEKRLKRLTTNIELNAKSNNIELEIANSTLEKEKGKVALQLMAIEKQTPKKVISKTWRYMCPTCGRLFWEKEHISNYCDNCGQKLEVDQDAT
jgi:rRNA maturation endonuclease Nob1